MNELNPSTELDTTPLSICVLTRDRPQALKQCLESIESQLGAYDELIILDNGPELHPLGPGPIGRGTVVYSRDNLGCPGGRNRLATLAAHETMVFVDDDGILTPGSITAIRRIASDSSCPAVAGGAVLWPISESLPEGQMLRPSWTFSGGIAMIRKIAFESVGGYPEDGLRQGEEEDLSIRLIDRGYRVTRSDAFGLWHPPAGSDRTADVVRGNIRSDLLLGFKYMPAIFLPAWVAWKIGVNLMAAIHQGHLHSAFNGVGDALILLWHGDIRRSVISYRIAARRLYRVEP